MKEEPSPCEIVSIASVVPQRAKKYKVTVIKHPDYSRCHEKVTLLATRLFSFLIDEFQFADVEFIEVSHSCNQEKNLTERLNRAFFKEEDVQPVSYYAVILEEGVHSYTSSFPNMNLDIHFSFNRQNINDMTTHKYRYSYAAHIPLSQKRKR